MSRDFPIDAHSRRVLIWRWTVFLLAAGFLLRQIVFVADYSHPGGPFRFLTIWAILLSFICASRMLAYSERRSDRTWPHLVSATAVVNALVVVLYWKLWLEDPALLNSGPPLPWWENWYLHGLGPSLQWIDALVVFGGLRRPWGAVPVFAGLVALYVGWVELFVGPANETPLGLVTSGLPYPFLNNMDAEARLVFYAGTAASGLVFLAGFALIAESLAGRRQPSAASTAARPDR